MQTAPAREGQVPLLTRKSGYQACCIKCDPRSIRLVIALSKGWSPRGYQTHVLSLFISERVSFSSTPTLTLFYALQCAESRVGVNNSGDVTVLSQGPEEVQRTDGCRRELAQT